MHIQCGSVVCSLYLILAGSDLNPVSTFFRLHGLFSLVRLLFIPFYVAQTMMDSCMASGTWNDCAI